MTDFYLDTEFNGHGGELISLALVSSDGFVWYEARKLSDPYTDYTPWVKDNVIPKLGRSLLSPSTFRESFLDFIEDFERPTIICDWHADLAHFISLLSAPDYASSMDYPFHATVLRTPPAPRGPKSLNPHNALADATALMDWHRPPQ